MQLCFDPPDKHLEGGLPPCHMWPLRTGFEERSCTKTQGAAFGFFHDLAVTEDYYVLVQNPTRLNFHKLLTEFVRGAPLQPVR